MRKNLKNMLTLVFVGIFALCSTMVGYAADTTVQGNQEFAQKDAAYWDEINDLKAVTEGYADSVARVGGHKNLSVPLKQQTKTYYCGPACVQMVLGYHGINKTQAVIAGKIGTTGAGSDVAPIRTYLNNQVGSGKYTYVNVTDVPLEDGLVYSIDKGRPLICMIQTKKLDYYGGKASDHFVVVTGYDWSVEGPNSSYTTLKINDPNYEKKYYGRKSSTWTEMTKALKACNGWYVMAK